MSPLTIAASGCRARIAPERGGMVTGFDVEGRALLFMDESTLADPTKNVRGGNPVLFPSPGKLAADTWSRDGRSGPMKQHGFARNRAWSVVSTATDAVVLRLDTEADASFPWASRLDLTYQVRAGALHVDSHVVNHSAERMPFGLGFHPYFALYDKRSFTLDSGATRAYDNVRKCEVPFDCRSLYLAAGEADLHLLDHRGGDIAFTCDRGPEVMIEASSEFSRWVLWSLPDRPFVCVEPWTCPGDALNSGDRLIWLETGEERALSVVVRA